MPKLNLDAMVVTIGFKKQTDFDYIYPLVMKNFADGDSINIFIGKPNLKVLKRSELNGLTTRQRAALQVILTSLYI